MKFNKWTLGLAIGAIIGLAVAFGSNVNRSDGACVANITEVQGDVILPINGNFDINTIPAINVGTAKNDQAVSADNTAISQANEVAAATYTTALYELPEGQNDAILGQSACSFKLNVAIHTRANLNEWSGDAILPIAATLAGPGVLTG